MTVSGSPTSRSASSPSTPHSIKLTSPSWDTIQDVFYRREEVYQMGWNVGDLSDYLICTGRNAGPIGVSLLPATRALAGARLMDSNDTGRA